ncbi:helix-turn-helix transcriptional regulator [Paenibacillus taichungensis]|uniref:helix-turn-helix domain-containing protein n=1 Tax=Paenibacillus TaxID=44249 RepID=UPI002DB8255D|nr:helix-turn-helix transcriptional regulator [Paenibacillus taichungensis]MEC0110391.1 helix-turn-helix transcriptional regulator [Paenibacillus taichungensis]MEC0200067.1 helix-turn-helix transcriptional regulator [Paenibacillus taichungensis]
MSKVNFALLKEYRVELSLRPEYVANLLGMSLSELNEIESGKIAVTSEQLSKLANIYGCPASYFYEKKAEYLGNVHLRNGHEMSANDQRQMAELIAFQKELSNHRQL